MILNRMKVKFILINILFVFILFFWEIGLSLSDRGTQSADVRSSITAGDLASKSSADPEFKKMDEIISTFQKKWGIMGLSAAVTKDGRLVYAKGFGYADERNSELVDANNQFRLASVSKLVTAIAIMQLNENEKFGLDDPVFGHEGILNDSIFMNYSDPRIEKITVRHLLTHTAGWSKRSGDPMFQPHLVARKMKTSLPVTSETTIQYVLNKKLNYEPGSRYSYSNIGYVILGKVIEKVSKMDYEDYVKLNILYPLGIYDMQLGNSFYEEKADNEVTYYESRSYGKVLAYNSNRNYVSRIYGGSDIKSLGAAGGWISSPAGLLRLVTAIDGFNSKPDLLQPESIRIMTSKDESDGQVIGWKGSDSYGTWWRTGTLTGMSVLVVRQKNGINWIIAMNSTTVRKSHIHSETFRMMSGAISSVKSWPEYDLFNNLAETMEEHDINVSADNLNAK
jgi:CubicO group peptidase (beta-lactamase class C family)